ncbi:hypothetical protein [Shouchella lonarensis]|nr:hypothetical protein [Shouchella lonarensis]
METVHTKVFTQSLFDQYLYYIEQHCCTLYEILSRSTSAKAQKSRSTQLDVEKDIYESLFLFQWILYHLEQLKLSEEMIQNTTCNVEGEETIRMKQNIVRILTEIKQCVGHRGSNRILKKVQLCIHYILCQEVLYVERREYTKRMNTYNHVKTAWLNRGMLNPYSYHEAKG